jgi:hypothetical protein
VCEAHQVKLEEKSRRYSDVIKRRNQEYEMEKPFRDQIRREERAATAEMRAERKAEAKRKRIENGGEKKRRGKKWKSQNPGMPDWGLDSDDENVFDGIQERDLPNLITPTLL